MTSAVQASNGKFYTGRAGHGWLGEKVEAYTGDKQWAEYKADLFNKNNGRLCGLTFKAVEMQFGTGEYK